MGDPMVRFTHGSLTMPNRQQTRERKSMWGKITRARGRLIIQHILDLLHNLGSQLGQKVNSPQVFDQLLGLGNPEDDGTSVRIDLGYPGESKLSHAAVQVCRPQTSHQLCDQ